MGFFGVQNMVGFKLNNLRISSNSPGAEIKGDVAIKFDKAIFPGPPDGQRNFD